jgi:hypothetical protein
MPANEPALQTRQVLALPSAYEPGWHHEQFSARSSEYVPASHPVHVVASEAEA